jgi:hypothetical protein
MNCYLKKKNRKTVHDTTLYPTHSYKNWAQPSSPYQICTHFSNQDSQNFKIIQAINCSTSCGPFAVNSIEKFEHHFRIRFQSYDVFFLLLLVCVSCVLLAQLDVWIRSYNSKWFISFVNLTYYNCHVVWLSFRPRICIYICTCARVVRQNNNSKIQNEMGFLLFFMFCCSLFGLCVHRTRLNNYTKSKQQQQNCDELKWYSRYVCWKTK